MPEGCVLDSSDPSPPLQVLNIFYFVELGSTVYDGGQTQTLCRLICNTS